MFAMKKKRVATVAAPRRKLKALPPVLAIEDKTDLSPGEEDDEIVILPEAAEEAPETEEDADEADEASPQTALGRYLRDLQNSSATLTPDAERDLALRIGEAYGLYAETLLELIKAIKRLPARRTDGLWKMRFDLFLRLFESPDRDKPKANDRIIRRTVETNDGDIRGCLREMAEKANGCPVRKHAVACLEAAAILEPMRETFCKANLRLVISIAKKFNHGQLPFGDLVQEGNIGLSKAIYRFDPKRGYRFSTYGSWWIRHAIIRAISNTSREVRVPVHAEEAMKKIRRAHHALVNELGQNPTEGEIAERVGMPVEKVRKYQLMSAKPLSLDRPIGHEDGNRTFIDVLNFDEPQAVEEPIANLHGAEIIKVLREELDRLKPNERDILAQRFGLDTDEERTLKEIGEQYSLSRERIRQIEDQALDRLRARMARRGFTIG